MHPLRIDLKEYTFFFFIYLQISRQKLIEFYPSLWMYLIQCTYRSVIPLNPRESEITSAHGSNTLTCKGQLQKIISIGRYRACEQFPWDNIHPYHLFLQLGILWNWRTVAKFVNSSWRFQTSLRCFIMKRFINSKRLCKIKGATKKFKN